MLRSDREVYHAEVCIDCGEPMRYPVAVGHRRRTCFVCAGRYDAERNADIAREWARRQMHKKINRMIWSGLAVWSALILGFSYLIWTM